MKAQNLPSSKMVKDKETFETWRKLKRGQKVGTRANPSNDGEAPDSETQKKNMAGKKSKPKGMKSSSIVSGTQCENRASEVGYGKGNEPSTSLNDNRTVGKFL